MADPLRYLAFDISEGEESVTTLDAVASTSSAEHAAVVAEAQRVLDWAWHRFPRTHGPVEDGMDWDHDLQVSVEEGRWHVLSLTLTASPVFIEEFLAAFAD